jgi:uncharacterized DUF497 family protein
VTAKFDPKKNAENLKKHGVSLSDGDGVLNDPMAVAIEDRSAEGEQTRDHWHKYIRLGNGRCLHASWRRRQDNFSAQG